MRTIQCCSLRWQDFGKSRRKRRRRRRHVGVAVDFAQAQSLHNLWSQLTIALANPGLRQCLIPEDDFDDRFLLIVRSRAQIGDDLIEKLQNS